MSRRSGARSRASSSRARRTARTSAGPSRCPATSTATGSATSSSALPARWSYPGYVYLVRGASDRPRLVTVGELLAGGGGVRFVGAGSAADAGRTLASPGDLNSDGLGGLPRGLSGGRGPEGGRVPRIRSKGLRRVGPARGPRKLGHGREARGDAPRPPLPGAPVPTESGRAGDALDLIRWDPDGVPDFLIGSPRFEVDGVSDVGKVSIVRGAALRRGPTSLGAIDDGRAVRVRRHLGAEGLARLDRGGARRRRRGRPRGLPDLGPVPLPGRRDARGLPHPGRAERTGLAGRSSAWRRGSRPSRAGPRPSSSAGASTMRPRSSWEGGRRGCSGSRRRPGSRSRCRRRTPRARRTSRSGGGATRPRCPERSATCRGSTRTLTSQRRQRRAGPSGSTVSRANPRSSISTGTGSRTS